MNVGLSPQHGLCQLFRPHPTRRNSYSSKNPQRVTVVTENFYNFVLRTRSTTIFYSLSPVNHQLIITWLTCTWPPASPQHPPRLLMTRAATLKTHVHSILKPRLH